MSNTIKQQASTLIEILIAVSIIALVLTSVSAMITMSIKLAGSNEQQQLALQKAQEAMEFFRRERSINSWYSFSTPLNDGSLYCISTLPESIASVSAQLGACGDTDVLEAAKYQFQREATIQFNNTSNIRVGIDVSWRDGNKNKNLFIEQNFENF